jgi:hypothetical protein
MKQSKPITISDKLLAKCDLPNQAERFDATVRSVLAYPRSEMLRHEAERRRQSALNPNRRGPKAKAVPSPAPADQPQV